MDYAWLRERMQARYGIEKSDFLLPELNSSFRRICILTFFVSMPETPINIGSIEELEDQIDALRSERNALHSSIREKKNRMKEINVLRQAIRDYRRTKDVYAQYKASGWSPKFYNEHRKDIEAHKKAQAEYSAPD